MKYAHQIDINLSRTKVLELFQDRDKMKHWQPGLVRFEHLSGEPGQPGARSELEYQMGKRTVQMTETIVLNDSNKQYTVVYEAPKVWNEVVNSFEESSPDKTRWICENEFRCKGMMRVMLALMPGAFKKQTLKYMNDFKVFAEGAAERNL